jgi:hypothetical protein
MKIASLAGLLLVLPCAGAPAFGADDAGIERMAICKDSWLDWKKGDPERLAALGDHIRTGFSQHGNDPFLVPKSSLSIAGLRVTQLYPDSVGMGVGLSVSVDAPFDETRRKLETVLGKPLGQCETSDGMRTCALKISDMRTVMVMAADKPKTATTLVGCYYYYEK